MSKHGKMELDEILSTLNKLGGAEGARKLRSGELTLVPRDPRALLKPLGEPVVLPAVQKFVARDAFTRANCFVYIGENFEKFFLPVVEENVPGVVVQVSKLVRDARDPVIATELKIHERGEMALAHFFHALRNLTNDQTDSPRTDGRTNVAYAIGTDRCTWSVGAFLSSAGWVVSARPMGDRCDWHPGDRFLSR